MVSAIITTYKRMPNIVQRAINSVLAQTYKDIEIIVVDDSPADYELREKVKEIVLSNTKKDNSMDIQYIAHEKNMGACQARNTGLNASRGEYVAYLDDDDEWMPTKIEKQLEVIEKTNVALVYCRSKSINEKKECFVRDDVFYRGRVLKELLYKNFIASTSFPLIRKECLVSIGGFDPLMQAAQDYDTWLRLAEKYEVDFVDEPLVIYHEHDDERITTNAQKRINGTERLCKKFEKYLEEDRHLWRARYLGLTRQYAKNGNIIKAISLWWQCVCKCPEKIKDNVIYFVYIIRTIISHKN